MKIEDGVKPLCDSLNSIQSVKTLWSCEGHPEIPSRPYVTFSAPLDIAFEIHKLLGAGRAGSQLYYNWWIVAHFDNTGTLNFTIEPNDYRFTRQPIWRLFSVKVWDSKTVHKDLESLGLLIDSRRVKDDS